MRLKTLAWAILAPGLVLLAASYMAGGPDVLVSWSPLGPVFLTGFILVLGALPIAVADSILEKRAKRISQR